MKIGPDCHPRRRQSGVRHEKTCQLPCGGVRLPANCHEKRERRATVWRDDKNCLPLQPYKYIWLMNEEQIKSLLEFYGIDCEPDFEHLVKLSVSSFTMLPKTNSWDESHMLQEKMKGLDFAAVCMKTLNVDSRTAYEIGLVKVVGWRVVDTFSSYMKPVAPLSKALRKSLPENMLQKIDEAPTLLDLWPQIAHFFESHVLYGSEASTRRLIYCVDACGLDFSPQAMPIGRGSSPEPAKVVLANGFDPDYRPAVSFAIEWAASRLKSRKKKPFSTYL